MSETLDALPAEFVAALRAEGMHPATSSVLLFAEALREIGVDHRWSVYWAGRSTLVHRPEDFAAYDRGFATFWLQREWGRRSVPVSTVPVVLEAADDGAEPGEPEAGRRVTVARWSPTEVLRQKDLARCSPEEIEESKRLIADLRLRGALRSTRRRAPVARGDAIDARRTLRRVLRTGGDAARIARSGRRKRPRRVVLLLDVSGSMEPYARALLRFAHAAVAGRGSVEVFALGTRLTRITRHLARHDPDAALAAGVAAVDDWGGGTRLGPVIRAFNDEWGVRGMARGAVMVILSDGWDRGDPDALAEQMARLRRVAHRVVWVNPLRASPGYAPLARGMAAALPYVDDFVDGHSIAALADLADVVAGPTRRAAERRQ